MRALFITPVVPALGGNGLAMRAGVVLELLSRRYEVSLLVVPIYEGPAALPAHLAVRCRRVLVQPPEAARAPAPEVVEELAQADVVHVFRLATVPVLERLLAEARGRGAPPRLQLDLDDLESLASQRLADLHAQRGEPELADRARAAAVRYAELETRALRRFSRVFLASPDDAGRLRRSLRGAAAEVHALPNAVRPPGALAPRPERRAGAEDVALFVGTLGHLPNADAVSHFCAEVLPLLRRPVRLDVVGAGAPEEVQRLAALPEVRLLGPVENLGPRYAAADVVVVPLRTGGGTRIKILEAFANGRPVVSTAVGAEGLAVAHREHLLVAASPEEFAASCRELCEDRALADRLAAAGGGLVARRYSVDAVSAAVADGL